MRIRSLGAVLVTLLGAAPALAQSVQPARFVITALDQVTGLPIPDVRVEVAGMRYGMHTNRQGVAVIDRIPPGGRMMLLSRLGYAPARILVELGEGEEGERTVSMAPEVVNLSGVTVRGERRDRGLDRRGFYDRERQGFGAFLTAERIDRIRPSQTYELFRYLRGYMVTYDRRGNPLVLSTRGPSGGFSMNGCAPLVFLDGMMVTGRGSTTVEALSLAPPETIAGIEAYAGPSTIPVEYNPTGSACGVILVWTRTGNF